jgi:hypothetical protein
MGFFGRRKAVSSGVEATAIVLGVTSEAITVTDEFDDLARDPSRRVVTGMRLRVQPPDGAPYDVELTGGQGRAMAAYYRGDGTAIPVKIDPDDPSVVVADEARARAAVEDDVALLEAIDSGDFEVPPESRWPASE